MGLKMTEEHPLVIEYKKTIPSKLENLRNSVEAVKKQKDLFTFEAFRRDVHKLAGSAGTYGFTTVSDICKNLDLDLKEKIQNFQIEPIPQSWYQNLDVILIKLAQAFEKPDLLIRF